MCAIGIDDALITERLSQRGIMLRLLLLPFFLVAIAVGAVATYGWSHFFRDRIHPQWDPNLAYAGHVEMQRHLAKCYEVGCPEAVASPVLACAWRDIIVE